MSEEKIVKEIITPFEGLSEQTYHAAIAGWMNNFRLNLPRIWKDPQITDLPKKEKQPAIIVGAGPSLQKFHHLEKIAKAKWKFPILVCDKVLKQALDLKLKPYVVASVDGSPLIANFYNIRPEKIPSDLNAVFAVTVHPKVVKTWKRRIHWFVPMIDPVQKLQDRSLTYLLCLIAKHKGTLSGIGNVGSLSWNIAAELGCSPLILIGFDFSEQVKYKEHGVYWNHLVAAFLKETGDLDKAQEKAALLYQVEENPDFKATFNDPPYYEKGKNVRYLVNPIWKGYRDQLAAHIVTSKIHTINCVGNGCIHTGARNKNGDFILKVPNFEAKSLEETLKMENQ